MDFDPTRDSGKADLRDAAMGDVLDCCVRTIRQHARFNPMMVCAECKQIIKCFDDERAYQNYLTFCRSRRRPTRSGQIDTLFTVVFRSYDISRR